MQTTTPRASKSFKRGITVRGRLGTGSSAGTRPLKPKKWTSKELGQVKYLLKRGLSNQNIASKLKGKTPRDVANLLSVESLFK